MLVSHSQKLGTVKGQELSLEVLRSAQLPSQKIQFNFDHHLSVLQKCCNPLDQLAVDIVVLQLLNQFHMVN